MSRFKADLLLLTAALIWGAAFVAQKHAFAHLGPCAFVFARFSISALVVLPFARREARRLPARLPHSYIPALLLVCLFFCIGVLAQQAYDVMPKHQGVKRQGDAEATWSASAEPFAHLALWGVKDLYVMVEALAARVAALEAAHAAG